MNCQKPETYQGRSRDCNANQGHDRCEECPDDGLGIARGVINGLLISLAIVALGICAGFALSSGWASFVAWVQG